MNIAQSVKIVMVNTNHPGNIGGVARAMKNMDLLDLWLVAPKEFPSPRALWRASNAGDVLDNATIVDTLEEAVADCALVYATSARDRRIPWMQAAAREAGEEIVQATHTNKVAVVFGREDHGLSNEEMQLCNRHITIPSSENYGVLNVAAAAQVVFYEIFMAANAQPKIAPEWDIEYATSEQVEMLYEHMLKVMESTGFYQPDTPKQMPNRLKRLLFRQQMDAMETNIMRGFLASVEKQAAKLKAG